MCTTDDCDVMVSYDDEAEKKAVSEAKARMSEAQSKANEAKKAAADASKAASRDSDALAAAEKKAKSAKETLLQTNDKLAATKAKGNTADLKQVEQLGGKVGKSVLYFVLEFSRAPHVCIAMRLCREFTAQRCML